jgi:transcriptional regulator with XRE-family HTH domain
VSCNGNPPEQIYTSAPLAQSLAELLAARPDLSVRALAKAVGVSPSHLSRVIRGADGKRPSLDLLQRLARTLGVPTDYFIETRTAAVIAVLKTDAGLTDNLYGKLGGGAKLMGRRGQHRECATAAAQLR